MVIYEALQLIDRGMVAFVGGGGKSSLMLKLAAECAQRGKRVLVTTSTKMFVSQLQNCGHFIIEQEQEKLLQKTGATDSAIIAAASGLIKENNKVVGFSSETLDNIFKTDLFDFILVEADGSRRLPMKAPQEGEPVLPSLATHVLAVTGVDVLNCPLVETHVQHSHLAAELARQQVGTLVTGETVRHIIKHYAYLADQMSQGARFVPVLNKADSTETLKEAVKVAQLLVIDYEMVLVTTAMSRDPVKEVIK